MRPRTGLEDSAVSPEGRVPGRPELLFKKALDAFRVEHTDAQLFEFLRRELRKPLFRPVRDRTEPLFNLAAKDRQPFLLSADQLALFTAFLVLAAQYFVL